jgi:hypothetical protein
VTSTSVSILTISSKGSSDEWVLFLDTETITFSLAIVKRKIVSMKNPWEGGVMHDEKRRKKA